MILQLLRLLQEMTIDYCRPLINKPPPLNRDYKRDPKLLRPFKRRGFINHGSTLGIPLWADVMPALKSFGPEMSVS